jgi:hypothetical protein
MLGWLSNESTVVEYFQLVGQTDRVDFPGEIVVQSLRKKMPCVALQRKR